MKKKKNTPIYENNTFLIAAIIIVVAIGLYFTLQPEVKPEKAAVHDVEIALLGKDCDNCFNITTAMEYLKESETVNILKLTELNIDESKKLVAKYNITRLPSIVITGDVAEFSIPNFDLKEEALVYTNILPPFYDVEEGVIKGHVKVTELVDNTCEKCFNTSMIVDQLKQVQVSIVATESVDINDEVGKELLEKYDIKAIPTLLMSNDALEYDSIKKVWGQVGTEEEDGTLILRTINPPYLNLSSGELEGLVTLTYLVDETCENCFDATELKSLFTKGFSMFVDKEVTSDVSSTKGKLWVKKYNISLIPTVVLSKEAKLYPGFNMAWGQVGSVEKDGNYVFRGVQLLEDYFKTLGQSGFVYKDLKAGKVINTAELEKAAEAAEEDAEETKTEEAEEAEAEAIAAEDVEDTEATEEADATEDVEEETEE